MQVPDLGILGSNPHSDSYSVFWESPLPLGEKVIVFLSGSLYYMSKYVEWALGDFLVCRERQYNHQALELPSSEFLQ